MIFQNKTIVKILFLCHKMPFPSNDGGAIATLNMIKGFENCGDDVTVLAMQTHKHSFPIEKLPFDIKTGINWNQILVNTKLNPLKALINLVFSNKPYNAVRFESKAFTEKLTELLLSQTFDIIQLEGLYLGSYINVVRKFSKAKIVLRAHNIEHEIWQRLAQNETSSFKKMYLQLLANRVKNLEFQALNKIDLLVPITQRDAEVFNLIDASRVWVSSTGIEVEKFKHTKPKNLKSLFYIGALDWLPNQESIKWFLENVWTVLNIDFPDWNFVIAGRNAPKKFVDELKKYNVNYLGEVESAIEFIDTYNIMVVPLHSGSGMRIKIIEGMARGKCIVTTKIGAEGILAEQGKDIFIQDLASDFIEVLKNLMHNQKQIEKCGENAFIFVQLNYNNQIIINELRNFYAKHLSSK